MKTQPIPETNDEPVKIVVGKSLRGFVHDKTKDQLIHFYDPANEECQNIEPKWNELAVRLADKENYVVGKFDTTENESKIIKIRSTPQIMFFPKGQKMGLHYMGDPLDVDAILAWAEEMEKLHPFKERAAKLETLESNLGLKMPKLQKGKDGKY